MKKKILSQAVKFTVLLMFLFVTLHANAQKKHLSCVGNSITAGYGLSNPSQDSYPSQLLALLGADKWVVGNYGSSGRTILKAGGYSYWDDGLYTSAKNSTPDYVVIGLGTNDSKNWLWDSHASEFKTDYKAMVQSFQNLAIKPDISIFLLVPGEKASWGIYNSYIDKVNVKIKEIALEMGLGLIDLHTAFDGHFPGWFQTDSVHPTVEGAANIALTVKNFLTTTKPEITYAAKSLTAPQAYDYQWYFNGTPVSSVNGGNQKQITVTEPGKYKVSLKLYQNSETRIVSNELNVTLTSTPPKITEVSTNEGGDTLIAKFNMKMRIPSSISALALKTEYNGQKNIPVLPGSFYKGDSTILFFPLGEKVYRDYNLSLTFSGNNIISADSGLLKTFSGLLVTNKSNGLSAHINSGKIGIDGFTLSLAFSKPIVLTNAQTAYFAFYKNRESIAFKNYSVANSTIQFILSKSVHYGDTVTITYTPGDIKAADKGALDGFNGFALTNQVSEPAWKAVPGKIEAEDFVFKSGMQTEATGDAGAGLILSQINDGDWAEYAIKNDSSKTNYQISFRVAAPADGGVIDFYVDDKSAGSVAVPSTGNWQVYQSVVKDISIPRGKHYLKVMATKAVFNLNYMTFYEILTGIDSKTRIMGIKLFPNPAFDTLYLETDSKFINKKYRITDLSGKEILSGKIIHENSAINTSKLPVGTYLFSLENACAKFNKGN
jgi:lysophospholipase L1-like esterase